MTPRPRLCRRPVCQRRPWRGAACPDRLAADSSSPSPAPPQPARLPLLPARPAGRRPARQRRSCRAAACRGQQLTIPGATRRHPDLPLLPLLPLLPARPAAAPPASVDLAEVLLAADSSSPSPAPPRPHPARHNGNIRTTTTAAAQTMDTMPRSWEPRPASGNPPTTWETPPPCGTRGPAIPLSDTHHTTGHTQAPAATGGPQSRTGQDRRSEGSLAGKGSCERRRSMTMRRRPVRSGCMSTGLPVVMSRGCRAAGRRASYSGSTDRRSSGAAGRCGPVHASGRSVS